MALHRTPSMEWYNHFKQRSVYLIRPLYGQSVKEHNKQDNLTQCYKYYTKKAIPFAVTSDLHTTQCQLVTVK